MSLVSRRRMWAYRLIRKAPEPPPSYGSAAWLELPEESAEKVAAVVIAAEAWARAGDDAEGRLGRELAERRRAEKRAEDAEYVTQMREHRARWRHLTVVDGGRYAGQQVRSLGEIGAEAR